MVRVKWYQFDVDWVDSEELGEIKFHLRYEGLKVAGSRKECIERLKNHLIQTEIERLKEMFQ